ncbi:LamG-like jellyroll fold domain-containing protein [Deltaproteobacteria bacterium TL4]
MLRTCFLFITSLLLSLSLLSCSDFVSDNKDSRQATESQSASAQITIGFPDEDSTLTRFISTAKFKGVVGDVTQITLTVKNGTTAVVTDKALTQTASEWTLTLTDLPVGVALTFEGHAYNATNVEIFNGSTQQTLVEADNTVALTLAPVDDAVTPTLPKISQVANPAKVSASKTATVSLLIGGTSGEKMTYQITAATNGGSFNPASGNITLTGTTATIALTYTAPATLAKYKHTFAITNSQGNIVSIDFEMEVVQQTTTSTVKVQFNPVVTALKTTRSGTDIIWTATVNDDTAASTLRYLWTFAGKTFVDATTNPATLQNYTEATTGNLVLKVTDVNGTGGSTTVTYPLAEGQFPDNAILNITGSTTGLVAYYPFNGNANDESGNGNNGTVNGATLATDRHGVANKAYSFNGSSNYIALPSGFKDFTGGITVSVWAYPAALNYWSRFIDFGNGASSDNILLANEGSSSTLTFVSFSASSELTRTSVSSSIGLNQWQHFVAVNDTLGNVYLFKNGVKIATGTSTGLPKNVTRNNNYIGKSNWSVDGYYSGKIDDLRIYNRALSAAEVSALYETEKPVTTSTASTVLQPGPEEGRDTFVRSSLPTPSAEWETYRLVCESVLPTGGWGDQYYSLLKFNLTSLPEHATSAKIYLYSIQTGGNGVTPLYLDQVTSSWNDTTTWSTKPTSINLSELSAPIPNEWYELDITELYNKWKSGGATNHGIQLRPKNTWNYWNNFYSSNYMDDPSLRPKLVITP